MPPDAGGIRSLAMLLSAGTFEGTSNVSAENRASRTLFSVMGQAVSCCMNRSNGRSCQSLTTKGTRRYGTGFEPACTARDRSVGGCTARKPKPKP